jgi:hypothetical protein
LGSKMNQSNRLFSTVFFAFRYFTRILKPNIVFWLGLWKTGLGAE